MHLGGCRVCTVKADGRSVSTTRSVFFERPGQPTGRDRADADRLRQRLRSRSQELALDAELRRRPGSRQVELEAEDPRTDADAW